MRNQSLLPESVGEIPGLSDAHALSLDIFKLRNELCSKATQMEAERELAQYVQRARSIAISSNPTLSLVFDIENTFTERTIKSTTDNMLSSSFVTKAETIPLPEGFVEGVIKKLRIQLHPDKGGDAEVAAHVAKLLEGVEGDPNFSVAKALVATPEIVDGDAQSLREERYRLVLALSGLKPIFANVGSAEEHAETEIKGAEWRVRTQAAFMSFELIIGDNDTWNRFLQRIARERHAYTIELVNRVQPEILSLQERIIKGGPKDLSDSEIEEVDAIFERIWTTLKKSDDGALQYNPPYQAWLEILLPAMRILDPGKKQGEEYTFFEPPFRVQRAPQPRFTGYGKLDEDLDLNSFKDIKREQKYELFKNINKENEYYNKN